MKRTEKIAQCADVSIVTSIANKIYLSGFTGDSGALIISGDNNFLLSDFRYTEQAAAQSLDWEYHEFARGKEFELIGEIIGKTGAETIGWEENKISLAESKKIKAAIENASSKTFEFVDISAAISQLRSVKEPDEIDAISRGCALGDKAFDHILGFIKPGISEIDIMIELEFYIRKNGASALSFPSIVASGENGSLPHAIPSNRKIRKGDMITLDFGCVVDGYCSDMTRTIAVGDIAQEQRNVYNIVLEAQKRAAAEVMPGMTGKMTDALARDYLTQRGYGEAFGHGLGHGVGLDIHEEPKINPSGETQLLPGMIFTIEPGVYIQGKFGVRIEDCGIITDEGFEPLTKSPKELIYI